MVSVEETMTLVGLGQCGCGCWDTDGQHWRTFDPSNTSPERFCGRSWSSVVLQSQVALRTARWNGHDGRSCLRGHVTYWWYNNTLQYNTISIAPWLVCGQTQRHSLCERGRICSAKCVEILEMLEFSLFESPLDGLLCERRRPLIYLLWTQVPGTRTCPLRRHKTDSSTGDGLNTCEYSSSSLVNSHPSPAHSCIVDV